MSLIALALPLKPLVLTPHSRLDVLRRTACRPTLHVRVAAHHRAVLFSICVRVIENERNFASDSGDFIHSVRSDAIGMATVIPTARKAESNFSEQTNWSTTTASRRKALTHIIPKPSNSGYADRQQLSSPIRPSVEIAGTLPERRDTPLEDSFECLAYVERSGGGVMDAW